MVKVLIAVDASEQAEKAYNFYLKNFHKDENEVIILHSGEPPKLPTLSFAEMGSFPADEISKILAENNKKANELENKYTMCNNSQKVKGKVIVQHGDGSPGERIVQAAKEHNVEVVIMGSRGLGTIRRTVLGSVSDYVVHHCKLPVLIVPKES